MEAVFAWLPAPSVPSCCCVGKTAMPIIGGLAPVSALLTHREAFIGSLTTHGRQPAIIAINNPYHRFVWSCSPHGEGRFGGNVRFSHESERLYCAMTMGARPTNVLSFSASAGSADSRAFAHVALPLFRIAFDTPMRVGVVSYKGWHPDA